MTAPLNTNPILIDHLIGLASAVAARSSARQLTRAGSSGLRIPSLRDFSTNIAIISPKTLKNNCTLTFHCFETLNVQRIKVLSIFLGVLDYYTECMTGGSPTAHKSPLILCLM